MFFIIRLLEILFVIGMVGSAVVVLLTFIEDALEAFMDDAKDSRIPPAYSNRTVTGPAE